jgi:hypothetical protein
MEIHCKCVKEFMALITLKEFMCNNLKAFETIDDIQIG